MRFSRLASFALVVALTLVTHPQAKSRNTDLELDISGASFRINGNATFLVLVSYFDAFDATTAALNSDFADLASAGFHGVRIFPNWWTLGSVDDESPTIAGDTLIDHNGDLRDWPGGPLEKFLEILDIAKEYGLVVDVSWSVETVGLCSPDPCTTPVDSLTISEFKDGLEDVTTVLANAGSAYKHVMFDLQNESNINPQGAQYSESDFDTLAEAVHAIDPHRIVFTSRSWTDINPNDDDGAEAATFTLNAELQVVAFHQKTQDQNDKWWDWYQTHASSVHSVTTSLPLYFQEDERYRVGVTSSWIATSDFQKALFNAQRAGAAAWTFHTPAGFYLNNSTFCGNLREVESRFIAKMSETLACALNTSCSSPTLYDSGTYSGC